jgi:cholesterol transport system auxiliary component
VRVFRANRSFQRASAGAPILTVPGARAAYIADTRWVAPAEVLFDEAVTSAFEASGGRVRLVSRGEPMRSDYTLRLDVRNFETDYGEGGAPAVLVRVRAVITRDQTRAPIEQIFEARVPAAQNRVSAIVAAYDRAVSKVLGDIVGWANSSVS